MRVQGFNQNYQVSRVATQKTNLSKHNQSFGAKLVLDADLLEDMGNSKDLTTHLLVFRDWLKTQSSDDEVLQIQKKEGKMVPQLTGYKYSTYGSPEKCVEEMRENLEFSIGKAKTGFCYNPKNNDEQIMKDFILTYMYLKNTENK